MYHYWVNDLGTLTMGSPSYFNGEDTLTYSYSEFLLSFWIIIQADGLIELLVTTKRRNYSWDLDSNNF
jgi:hypothetical protein